jgi:hypothetical protein
VGKNFFAIRFNIFEDPSGPYTLPRIYTAKNITVYFGIPGWLRNKTKLLHRSTSDRALAGILSRSKSLLS